MVITAFVVAVVLPVAVRVAWDWRWLRRVHRASGDPEALERILGARR